MKRVGKGSTGRLRRPLVHKHLAPAGESQKRRKIFLRPNKVKNVDTHVKIVKSSINSNIIVTSSRRCFERGPICGAWFVYIAGLDPAIHHSAKRMEARVKPAHDGRATAPCRD
jgi:hypothetical protein